MKIQDLLQKNPEGLAIISLEDLKEFAEQIVQSIQYPKTEEDKQETISYSADQVSRILNVDKSTLWRWQQAGYLLPYKIGKRNFYDKEDVDRILNKKN